MHLALLFLARPLNANSKISVESFYYQSSLCKKLSLEVSLELFTLPGYSGVRGGDAFLLLTTCSNAVARNTRVCSSSLPCFSRQRFQTQSFLLELG